MMQEFVKSVDKTAKRAIAEIHTAVPATVLSVDLAKGTISAQPKAQFKKPNRKTIDYPQISGIPLVYPHSGNVTIAFPVKPGDDCLLVFSEKPLDYWMYGKETDTELNFDLSNAIAIPGLEASGSEAMSKACLEDAVVVKNGNVSCVVKADRIAIEGNVEIVGDIVLNGSLTAADDVIVDGKSFVAHVHTGDSGGTTSAPQ